MCSSTSSTRSAGCTGLATSSSTGLDHWRGAAGDTTGHRSPGGAALDRIAHAYLTDRIEPLTLASRAQLAISLLDSELSYNVARLLD